MLPYAYPTCPFLRPWEACTAWNDTRVAGNSAVGHLARFGLQHDAAFAGLLHALRGRAVLFMGDSVQRQLFSSFACSMHAQCPACLRQTAISWTAHPKKRCHGKEEQCEYSSACASFQAPPESPYEYKRGPVRFNRDAETTLCSCDVSSWLPVKPDAASVQWAKSRDVNLANPWVAKCLAHYKHLAEVDVIVYGSAGLHRLPWLNSQNQLAAQAEQEVRWVLRAVNKTWAGRRAPHLIWRELTAQHFADGPAGFFLRARPDGKRRGNPYVHRPAHCTCSCAHYMPHASYAHSPRAACTSAHATSHAT